MYNDINTLVCHLYKHDNDIHALNCTMLHGSTFPQGWEIWKTVENIILDCLNREVRRELCKILPWRLGIVFRGQKIERCPEFIDLIIIST